MIMIKFIHLYKQSVINWVLSLLTDDDDA